MIKSEVKFHAPLIVSGAGPLNDMISQKVGGKKGGGGGRTGDAAISGFGAEGPVGVDTARTCKIIIE